MMIDVERSVSQTVGAADTESHMTTSSDSRQNVTNDSEPEIQKPRSLLKRLKSLKEDSDEPKDCFDRLFAICCGSAAGIYFMAVSSGILIAMVAMGSVYLNECSAERYIPIYLIVGGCFGLLQNILSSTFKIISFFKSNDNSSPSPGLGLLYLFTFSWYIAGSVWVYRTYGYFTTVDRSAENYCHPAVYWFTFALITAGYVFAGLIIAAGIIALCYVQCS